MNLSLQPYAFSLYINNNKVSLLFQGLPATVTLEPDSELIFNIRFSSFFFGQHAAKFVVDYAGPEFSKTNNERAEDIVFDSPEFVGPNPPAWLGASSNQIPGRVDLTWQLSTDPNVAYYNLYISSVKGLYSSGASVSNIPNNVIGISLDINSPFWNMPLYYTIVAVNSLGQRGNYSPDSWAIAYSNPENYRGTISGRVYDLITNQGISNATFQFFTFPNSWFSDQGGNYSINFYPGFYLIDVSAPNYLPALPWAIQVVAWSGNGSNFGLQPIPSNQPPPVSGLYGSAGNNQVVLNWNPYTPPSDFKQFDIFRSNYQFWTVGGGTIIATTSNPSATSFTDTGVINGIDYFYAVAPKNNSGSFPDVSSIGPFRPGSAPTVDNVSASQSGGDVLITYNLNDPSGKTSYVSFEYWTGSAWVDATTTVGEGVQNPGVGKTGTWQAKQDLPGWDSQIKIRIRAYQDPAPVYGESPLFNLDTKNPTPPFVYPLPTITGLFQKTLGGTKEANTAIKSAGVEIIPQNSSASWEYSFALKQGLNQFSFTAIDAFGNESASSSVSTTYDPDYFICGDVNGDESLDVFDMTLLIDVLFSGHAYPAHPSSMDVNNDGQYDVFDLVGIIEFIFSGGAALTCPAV